MSALPLSADRLSVIDIDHDPVADRARRRRTLARIGLPLGGVGLIIGFLLGVGTYADSANRAGVLELSDTLLHGLRERIALQVGAYLQPASHAALLAQSMLGRGGATTRAAEAYAFASSVLNETPQVANVLFADGAGDFMLVRRAIGGPAGATETKRILNAPPNAPTGRTVEWTTRDRGGAVTAQRLDPSDDYDARTRSWFIGARAADKVFWSGAYIFFSERAPGITTSVHGPDDDPDVVGIDIKLDALSSFLGGLSIGKTGRAYIVSPKGEMIAGPDPARILHQRDGKLTPAKVEEVGDSGLSGSWDRFRVQGPGTKVIEADDGRLISIVTPIADSGQDWLLVICVPERDFSGFVSTTARRAGLLSAVVVVLSLGLAVLLVRQGLRADRADREVAERSAAVRAQSAAFARMATEAGRFAQDGTPPAALVETLAEATGARRAGIWRWLGHALRCSDSFETATRGHVAGVELARGEIAALLEALLRGDEIDVADARRDRRTQALHGLLMAPLGSTRLMAVPVMVDGALRGAVLLEDARPDPAARDLVRACATLVGLCLPPATATPTATPTVDVVARPKLAAASGPPVSIDPTLVDAVAGSEPNRVSALVLRLPDAAGGTDGLYHRLTCAAQEIAARHGIAYFKMLGSTIVAVSGDADGAAGRAQRLADVAIELRDACAALLDGEEGLEVRLGLDAGPVQGGRVGLAPGMLNMSGATLQGAEELASSAPAGTIQASEAAYAALKQSFLFRPRGLFYRPDVGEMRSYVLAGRA